MAIKTYTENGQQYYKVYVNYRSPIDQSKRVQKHASRLKTEAEARREERKLLQEAIREVERMDGRGFTGRMLSPWDAEGAGYSQSFACSLIE